MNRHMMPSKMQGKLHGFGAGGTHNASSQKNGGRLGYDPRRRKGGVILATACLTLHGNSQIPEKMAAVRPYASTCKHPTMIP